MSGSGKALSEEVSGKEEAELRGKPPQVEPWLEAYRAK